jgi:hypothetical protein
MSNQFIEARDGRVFRLNTPEEYAAITATAMADPDCRPYADDEWQKALPTAFYGHPANRPAKAP